MRTISSHEYKEVADRRLEKGASIEQKEQHAIHKIRAKVLRKAEAATGLTANVITEKDPGAGNVAACVNFSTRQVSVAEDTLAANDNGWAIYALRHEKEHLLSGINALDIKKDLSADHKNFLADALILQDLEVDAMEGFNDLSTIKKYGKHNRSGYLKKEVPFAEKLEKLSVKETGHSLLEIYRKGNAQLLNYRVRQLADRLLCKQAFNELKQEKGSILNLLKLNSVANRLQEEPPAVTTIEQAREAVAKLFAEQDQIATIRTKLAA